MLESTDAVVSAEGDAPPTSGTVGDTGGQKAVAVEKTIAEGGAGDKTAAAAASEPLDNWRVRMAGDNKKFLKRLDMFDSEAAFAKSYQALETKLSQPKGKPTLSDKATPEQIAEYRRDVGVPEDGKYNLELGGGFVWSDEDKPVLDNFAKAAHASNIPQAEVSKVLAWYKDHTQALADAKAEADATFARDSQEALREELGTEFKRTVNASGIALTRVPEDLRNDILLARLPDGKLLGNHPSMVKFLSQITHDLNPEATIVPAGPTKAANGEQRMQELRAMMADDRSPYWVGPTREALQQEYRDRLEALDRSSKNASR